MEQWGPGQMLPTFQSRRRQPSLRSCEKDDVIDEVLVE